ncbi:MAG: ABC transporter ATP-binding protein [Clostridiales bacterium]|nr:ABC transporter ATP-binding protein [Clostridiales bacterium]
MIDYSRPRYITVEHLNKSFLIGGQRLSVLEDISFEVKKGEVICIVGGSGCGKSTLLRTIAGLDRRYEGSIQVEGQEIDGPKKSRGLVFQESRLFPWLTVEGNVLFALDEGSKQEKQEKAQKMIDLVGLRDFADVYPNALSGGMAQRTNIARAMVNNPPILLLDEPFGALDAFTKVQLQNELLKIEKTEETTLLFVTHDIEEAVYLADRVIVLSARPGKIEEIVSVDLPRPRDRNDQYFTELKKRIYAHFYNVEQMHEEYNI